MQRRTLKTFRVTHRTLARFDVASAVPSMTEYCAPSVPSVVLTSTLVLGALLATGCSVDCIRVVERIDAAVDTTPRSEGCSSPQVVPGYTLVSIDVDGGARTYGLVVPVGDVSIPRPLVFGFDGHGTSQACRDTLGLEVPAAGGAIFVYPENHPDANGDRSWLSHDAGNLAFFDTLVTTLKQKACVSSVFVAGYGSGGGLSNTLACLRSGVIRGIAALSGGGPESGCENNQAAAFITHGDLDPITSAVARDYWLAQDGCGTTTRPVAPPPCVSYDGCQPGFPVTWCEFSGVHEIPPWTAAAVWGFFTSLP